MSAVTVWQGLEACFKTVQGLKVIMLGEPTAIHDAPLLYTVYQEFDRPLRNAPPARNLTGMAHVFAHRLVIQWVDNPQAEMQLLTLIDAIPDSVDRDPHLSGLLNKGMAGITRGITGFATIGGTLYRVADYTGSVLEKREGT